QPHQPEALAAEAAPPAPQREDRDDEQEQRVELVHALLPAPIGSSDGCSVARLHGATRCASEGALARRHGLFLPPHARLLVVLAFAKLGEDAGLLALLLETADRALDGLVLFDPNPCHVVESPPPSAARPEAMLPRPPRRKGGTIK